MGSVRHTAGRTLLAVMSSKGKGTRTILPLVMKGFAIGCGVNVLGGILQEIERGAGPRRLCVQAASEMSASSGTSTITLTRLCPAMGSGLSSRNWCCASTTPVVSIAFMYQDNETPPLKDVSA